MVSAYILHCPMDSSLGKGTGDKEWPASWTTVVLILATLISVN